MRDEAHVGSLYLNLAFSVMMPLPGIVKELNDFQPAILFGYPTAFLLLAQEQRAGRLALHPVEVVTGGEWLAPSARKEIKEAFRCRVHDVYAASEFLGIVFDCGHGWLHDGEVWENVPRCFRGNTLRQRVCPLQGLRKLGSLPCGIRSVANSARYWRISYLAVFEFAFISAVRKAISE